MVNPITVSLILNLVIISFVMLFDTPRWILVFPLATGLSFILHKAYPRSI